MIRLNETLKRRASSLRVSHRTWRLIAGKANLKPERGATVIFGLLMLTLLPACAPVRLPPPTSLDSIIIDMPHGGWRIHVFPDGSGGYSFGALPELGEIEADTFDFNELYLQLAARVTDERDPTASPGTVQFCVEGEGCGELLYFYDQAFVDELFDEAYAHRTGQSLFGGPSGIETIDRLWQEREDE